MPLYSTSSVRNTNPGQITVVVENVDGGGGTARTVNVTLTVDGTEAHFVHDDPSCPPTAGVIFSENYTIAAWRDVSVTAGQDVARTVFVELANGVTPPINVQISAQVQSSDDLQPPYAASPNAVISFPVPVP